jgi:hypothetical protein
VAAPLSATMDCAAGAVSRVVTGMLPETLIWASAEPAKSSATAREQNRAEPIHLETVSSFLCNETP